jgi:hypothetical protein
VSAFRRTFSQLRQAEVQNFDLSARRDLDIRGLQVAMDDVLVVGGVERIGDLLRDGEGLIDRDRPMRNPIAERGALDELHDDPAGMRRLFETIDRRNVRMIQRGKDFGFAL